jgi:5-formyltetrahydrofolate cyclo-ligase
VKDRNSEPERGSEWELIKILLEGDRDSNKMNLTSNTRLRLNYPSWSRPRSHWSATDPRNQQTTFRAKKHQDAQRKLARLTACATLVRPMAALVRPDDRVGQVGGYSSRTTNVPESLSDFSRPWNKNTSKTQPAWKENPTQNLAQLQIDQELTSNTTTQRHTSQAAHPRQILQMAHTGKTGH